MRCPKAFVGALMLAPLNHFWRCLIERQAGHLSYFLGVRNAGIAYSQTVADGNNQGKSIATDDR
jgi:hypothetical protein